MGCGWYGMPLAIRLTRSGFNVSGSTTTPAKAEMMREHGISDYIIELRPGLHSPGRIDSFFDADALILNIPPGRGRDNSASRYRLLLDNLMPHLISAPLSLVVFISSTSVYADLNKVMSEEDAGKGRPSDSGRLMLQAEQTLMERSEFATTVLRFGGLYGNDRHPARYLAGRTGLGNPEGPVNLVHLEDCIRITERILRKQIKNEVFNVVCDEHPNRKTYYTEMCRRLGLAKPQFSEPAADDAWKQVSNRKLKQELGYCFKYPTPYEGY
jgi:nucleoside-diphosphate-sugar epimerase